MPLHNVLISCTFLNLYLRPKTIFMVIITGESFEAILLNVSANRFLITDKRTNNK